MAPKPQTPPNKRGFKVDRPFVHSTPIPLEPDSDSDFNPGAVSVSPPKVKKRKATRRKGTGEGPSTSRPRGRKRRIEALSGIRGGIREKKEQSDSSGLGQRQKAFAAYFQELDLQSASEGENADGEEEDDIENIDKDTEDEDEEENEEKDEEEDEDDGYASANESRHGKDEVAASRAASISSTSRTVISRVEEASQQKTADDSVTESETEPEDEPPPQLMMGSKRKIIDEVSPSVAVKKARTDEPVGDDSVTEPESETEPESDEDYLPEFSLDPRPAFEKPKGQRILPPFYLEEDKSVKVPAWFNTFLRDYQRDGIKFFYDRFKQGRGGLLGDDMGLGKTIQIIGFLLAIMHKYGDERDSDRRYKHVSKLQDGDSWKKHRKLAPANETWPTALIIAPSSVVGNWEREFQKWGYFEVGNYSGSDKDYVLKNFNMGRLDVLLMSFETALRDIELLYDLAASVIIVDEAHRVKNPRAKSTIAFHRFECPVRFGLTGTAIQNSYSELWNIINWTHPGCVGSKKQWEGYVDRPLTKGQSKSASAEERLQAVLVARILKDKVLPDNFLRRTKSIIKDQLPEKIDEVVFCPLTLQQIEVYKRILSSKQVQDLVRKDEPCECGSRAKRKDCCHPYEKGALFKFVSALIKVSNHLALVLPSPSDSSEQIARNRELADIAFPHGRTPKFGPAMLVPDFCGKWMILQKLLEQWRKDPLNKVLIFTKSVKLLDMLDFHLKTKGLGFLRLEGKTPPSERMPMIDRFHEDPDVFIFLVSTLAGGTGLNLTGANKVVIFDPNWNPAHDLQAMDRAYRYGQTRNVSVYRLLAAGSIEELIYARQVYKQQQMAVGYNASLQTRYFEGVQGEKTKQGELFGIKNLFKLHEDTLATKMTIERATMTDLNWALAHMESKSKRRIADGVVDLVREAKPKGEKEYDDLDGLELLLFDESAPDAGQDDIHRILNDIGVDYTHRNEHLIKSNAIEERRVQALLEEKKKAKQQAKERAKQRKSPTAKDESPQPSWPPKRRHHKPPMTAEQKLQARQMAMIDLGIISSIDDVKTFAQEFTRKSEEEQRTLLSRLDERSKQMQKGK
ncbi:unnamed protein product [Somion occarium]|uniref:Uncharacterized protein n=1 Tax=Somion occarium TaxID=3059160 RepID=A0ABP1CTD2_9APHY